MSHSARQDDTDIDSFMSSVMDTQHGKPPRRRFGIFGRNKKRRQKARQPSDIDRQSKAYLNEALGIAPQRSNLSEHAPQKQHKKPNPQPAIVIQIHGFDLRRRVRVFYKRYRRLLKKLAWLLAVLLAILFLVSFGRRIIGGKQTPAPSDIENIAPSGVYVPAKLPDGYSVGSGSEELENGAIIYTIYTDKGSTVTVTQQARPDNLEDSVFAGAQSFDTRLGKAYIVETIDRITGYILAEESMLLFNSTGHVGANDMKKLMESFQP